MPIEVNVEPEIEIPIPQTPAPKKKKVLLDSLNDRSDDEDGEERASPGDRESPIQEEDDEFDRDDMGTSADNVKPQLETIAIS